ncbi:CD48 antigen-like [Clinocottus analis]|uniref:CD48 antigen-like n=1 Tax=Clinocottus analis TaxID=304258 RepID=UPI0035C12B18
MWKTLFVLQFAMNADSLIYSKVGGSVVLTLECLVPPSAPISTITWKHEQDLAVEWINGDQQAYRQFEGCVALNSSTAALTITGLTGNHSGRYAAEINNNKPTNCTELLVIAPVSKPSVSSRCDLQMTFCLFTCEADTAGAEPVWYRWWPAGGVNATKLLNVTKENKEFSYSCQVENPVSSQSSDPMPNPFTTRNRLVTLICLIPIVVAVAALLFLCFFKKEVH